MGSSLTSLSCGPIDNPAGAGEEAASVPERERRDCGTCGRSFEALFVIALGVRIVARHCPVCVEEYEAEQARRQAASRVRATPPTAEERWAAFCPREYRTTAEGGRTDAARLAAECPELDRIVGWSYGDQGLVLRGATGLCKTRAMWRLLRRLFDEGRTLEVLTAGEWGRSYADAAGQYQSSAWFTRMTTVQVLCIDDLGKGAWSEAVRAVFFDVVDKRMRTGLPFLATTNDDGAQLAEKMRDPNLGDPLIRRLREFCQVIALERAQPEGRAPARP